jgi:hypothetical protein
MPTPKPTSEIISADPDAVNWRTGTDICSLLERNVVNTRCISFLSYCLFVGQAFAAGPFGFECGMTKEQVVKLVGQGAVKHINWELAQESGISNQNDMLMLSTAPKPHKDFGEYLLLFAPKLGLVKLVAIGKPVPTSRYGDDLKNFFLETRDAIADNYGTPETFDSLRFGSIWNEPQDWMTGLLKGERTLMSGWELKTTRPNHITGIMLKATASSTEEGHLELIYEFEGFTEYERSQKAKATTVF